MDQVIESIGPFGRSQKIYFCLMGTITSVVGLHFFASVFFTAEPEFTCSAKRSSYSNLNLTKCEMWTNFTHNKQSSPYVCEFKDKYYNLTIVNEWGLVCDKQYLIGLSQSYFFVGALLSFLNGYISDKLGRKRSCMIFIGLQFLATVVYQVLLLDTRWFSLDNSSKFMVYNAYQLVTGIMVYCIYSTTYILAFELTSDKYHILLTNILISFYIMGEIWILIAYYVTRNWRITSWFISSYFTVFCLGFVLIVPESPRWLFAINRKDEALQILRKIAKMNKTKSSLESIEAKGLLSDKAQSINEDPNEKKENIFRKIFCSNYIFYLIGLFYIWNSLSLNYVGVSLGLLSTLNINPYLMFLLSAIFEFIGAWLSFIGDKVGRKRALLFSFLSVSICSFLVSLLPDDNTDSSGKYFLIAKICLALASRCMVSTSYNLTSIYTTKLFDVSVRSTVLLFLTSIGCLASLISPQINLLRVTWKPLPYYIYSATSLLSSIILIFLPEIYHHNQHKQLHD